MSAVTKMAIVLVALSVHWTAVLYANGTNKTDAADKTTVIVAVGAAGEEDFGKGFAKWAELWSKASDMVAAKHVAVGLAPTNATATCRY